MGERVKTSTHLTGAAIMRASVETSAHHTGADISKRIQAKLNVKKKDIGLHGKIRQADPPDTVLQGMRPSARFLNGRPPDTVLLVS